MPVSFPKALTARARTGAAGLALLLLSSPQAAHADAAAGRAAFEAGNYTRAMSEWQSAADRGDADAELGLGMLYELGAGELKQDYKRAGYWYEKAAEHNNSEAEYRLALIWSAGLEGFSPDPVEAYKWIVLAAESQGVWGGLASELKGQLEEVVGLRQREEAKKRVAAWKEAHTKKPEAPPPVIGPSVTVAPGGGPTAAVAPGKPAAGGCPGWPFPTLPCTEQFPSLPGVAPPKLPAMPPPRPPGPN